MLGRMKILLTGGTGFLGRYIADRLAGDGHEVVALVRPSSIGKLPASVTDHRIGGFDEPKACGDAVVGTDAVVHAGWWTPGDSFVDPPEDPIQYYRTNVLGSLALLGAAQASATRFVFISTGAVHGKTQKTSHELDEAHPLWPTTHYGAAKAAVETAIHAAGYGSASMPACTIRPTSIYGVDDPVSTSRFYDLVHEVATADRIRVSGGGKIVHAGDVAAAVGCVLTAPAGQIAGETFNCTGGFVPRRQIAELTAKTLGRSVEIVGEPPGVGNRMSTAKIESLGMRFDQSNRLLETVQALVSGL